MVDQEQSATRPNLDLEMIGLRQGDTLSLVDEPEIICMVVELSPPRVLHEYEVKSLTAACNEAYGVTYNDPASVWVYGGETLGSRRKRFEDYHRI